MGARPRRRRLHTGVLGAPQCRGWTQRHRCWGPPAMGPPLLHWQAAPGPSSDRRLLWHSGPQLMSTHSALHPSADAPPPAATAHAHAQSMVCEYREQLGARVSSPTRVQQYLLKQAASRLLGEGIQRQSGQRLPHGVQGELLGTSTHTPIATWTTQTKKRSQQRGGPRTRDVSAPIVRRRSTTFRLPCASACTSPVSPALCT